MGKTVITYGTFDLFHIGHLRLLQRARQLGDKLIVGVTSENYDRARGKLNVKQSLAERIENVRRTGLADMIIVEEYEGQKIEDIQRYNVDIFVIGSDWRGKFDYLKKFCEVVYLERTKDISSTLLRNMRYGITKMGIVGCGRIAHRFIREMKYVSGVEPIGVFCRNREKAERFRDEYDLLMGTNSYEELLDKVDAVYIATPHSTHYPYAKEALLRGKHVLCEKPITLSTQHLKELMDIARERNLVLLEALKTAFFPGFIKLMNLARTGVIGDIVDVTASFTKLIEDKTLREYLPDEGGSVTELASYVLLPVIKLTGELPKFEIHSITNSEGVDIYSKINLIGDGIMATGIVGIGAKREGDLVIAGTRGYIYVPSPWWLTQYFEIRDDNGNVVRRYCETLHGDGLRYVLAEFLRLIEEERRETYKWTLRESLEVVRLIEHHLESRGRATV